MNNPISLLEIHIFLGIFSLLFLAGIIGNIATPNASAHWQNLIGKCKIRITAWWFISSVLCLSYLFGHIGSVVLFAAVSFVALREFMTLIYRRRSEHNAIAACFYVILPAQYYFILVKWYDMLGIFIPVYAFLLLPIINAASGDTHHFFARTAKIHWGIMVSIFCISYLPALLTLDIPSFEHHNILLLLFMIGVMQAHDIFQYLWDKLGKRKIMPALSPSKTMMGALGGISCATLFATTFYWITPFSPLQAAFIGLILCVIGFFGSLIMSAIKGSFGAKDWGRVTLEHGGMLDYIGSMCFAAPVLFYIVRYFWT